MSPRKRMGNDPFENSPAFKTESKSESSKPLLDKKNPVPNNSSIKKTIASEFPDESGEILGKLNLALQNIEFQKDEIELLRKELNELKNRSHYSKNTFFNYWLRFWFPWFPF